MSTAGKVWLVGAGPGDPELLTLKAVRALEQADVILCDDLVPDEILERARRDARVVRVGKRGGRPSTSQAFIERLMVAEARRGHRVVRLKGGDPFVFGRGGEECDALRAAGIDYEVVNGITAGLAAAASAGVALTRRGVSRGAILVSGQEGEGEATDWAALARTGLPLVIYMGVAASEAIRGRLLAAGMAAATPVAVVSNATRREEDGIATRLDRFPEDLRRAGLASPAIVIVGEVTRAALRSAARNPATPARPQRNRLP
ncbi:MAG TPA: uroporphyrinogen-III C-methyltransferase [Usitatibacter sp.]|nr:uroporphyrinogen-III C-methyltransferase [Usitatibacter sp.]